MRQLAASPLASDTIVHVDPVNYCAGLQPDSARWSRIRLGARMFADAPGDMKVVCIYAIRVEHPWMISVLEWCFRGH